MIKLLRKMNNKEKILSFVCLILVLGQVYFDLTMPEYMSQLTILIQTPNSEQTELYLVGLKMLGCALASLSLAIMTAYLVSQIASAFSMTLRKIIFKKISNFSKEDMDEFSSASLIVRTSEDVRQVQVLLAMGLQIVIKAPIMAVWAVFKIINKSLELSLVTAVFILVLLGLMICILIILIPKFKLVQKLVDNMNVIAQENLNGISVVHAFNAEAYQNQKFKRANDALTNLQLFNQHTMAILLPAMTLGMSSLSLVVFWLGAHLIEKIPELSGRLTLFANVVVFSNYAGFVMMSLMMIVIVFIFIPPAQVSANRINEVLERHIKIQEGEKTGGSEEATIEFKNVSFRYPNAGKDILSNISFKAKKGQTIAFIGATGSGKTSLVNLAARIYDASQGQILLNGLDIREYSFDALYEKVAYVMQKAVLFSGNIFENVNFGIKEDLKNQEDTWRALNLAKASEFVEKMPEKLYERVARGGANLSGGQKQRLSIARAIIRKPEILIFDDSFSALDYKTDSELRRGLDNELKDTTKLIVGQRIGTIMNADKIIVLDHGQIVGMGKHDDLLKTCPVYYEIASSQLSEEELKGGGKL